MWTQLELLLLVGVANGVPILGYVAWKRKFAAPLSARWLGASKTWRGLALSLAGTTGVALLLGHPALTGLVISVGAMAGDLLSSFLKRRLGRPPGSMVLGLDQIPESALPLVAVSGRYGLDAGDIAILVAAFLLLELLFSRFLFRLHLRKHPH